MLRVGVVGATGYAGAELVKILLRHEGVTITELARGTVDKPENYSNIYPVFKGTIDLPCKTLDAQAIMGNVDVVFLALPHKASMDAVPHFIKAGKIVIDLSADYRLPADVYTKWYGVEHKDAGNLKNAQYGLSELYPEKIKKSKFVANPGCYPTSVILGLAPFLKDKAINTDSIIVDAKSGVSGAGRKADLSLSYCETNENLKAYKVNEHQHQPEINRILSDVAGSNVSIVFTPHLVPLNRGMLSTIYVKLSKPLDTAAAVSLYKKFYEGKKFVRVLDAGIMPEVKNVAYTNYCDIGVKVTGDVAIIISCIDNLVKGAAGQAVQNMNLMCGFNETESLI